MFRTQLLYKKSHQLRLIWKLNSQPNPRLVHTTAVIRTNVCENATKTTDGDKSYSDSIQQSTTDEAFAIDRTKFDILVKRRFIYDQSYEIYGGASGFYDLGPVGCALKSNLLNVWRQFFILKDQIHEIDCPALTIEPVFKASGHIDRFSDFLIKDTKTNECFRVDHLIKSYLKQQSDKDPEFKKLHAETLTKLDGATKSELEELISKLNLKSPTTGNELSKATDFNLMFSTPVGPFNNLKGFLRPETAQGIFVNFKRLLEYNHERLPFAAAQIGNAFRNEIAPRSGLLRLREFTMAEIEYFFDPNESTHSSFQDVQDIPLFLYSASNQTNGERAEQMTIGEAVNNGLIASEALGYFLARIQQFLIKIGISPEYLRFRQHMSNEMAHYAADCWDAECLTSYGWIECVGCANRSAFDLKQHTNASGISLTAERRLQTPKQISTTEITPRKEFLKKLNNKMSKLVNKHLAKLSLQQRNVIVQSLNDQGFYDLHIDDKSIRLEKSSVEVTNGLKTVHVEEIIPNVIEPSFGIGRILYVLLEHSFRKRNGDSNSYFALPASIAAHKCSILPLVSKAEFQPYIKQISAQLIEDNISHKIDDMSGSIGRRYIRSDEIGIPFCITIDYDTMEQPNTITLRERDTKEQIRIPIDGVNGIIQDLCREKLTWRQLSEKYPKYEK